RSVWSPLVRPPLGKLPGAVPVGHPPIVHKPPDTAPPAPETYALAQFASAPARLVPDLNTGTGFCRPSAGSSCNKGRDVLWDPLGRGSLLYRISWCARRRTPGASVSVETKLRPAHVRTKVLQEESSWIYPTAYTSVGTYKKKNAFSLTPFYVVRPPLPLPLSILFGSATRSEEHTSELQSRGHLVCRLLLEKKKKKQRHIRHKSRRIS